MAPKRREPASTKRTFSKFRELPTELRLQIWEALLWLSPRMVRLNIIQREPSQHDRSTWMNREGSDPNRRKIRSKNDENRVPTILKVDRESREVALKFYTLIFQNAYPLYFNSEIDKLYFPHLEWCGQMDRVKLFILEEAKNGIDKIRNLAWDQEIGPLMATFSNDDYFARYMSYKVPSLTMLDQLPALREVFFVITGLNWEKAVGLPSFGTSDFQLAMKSRAKVQEAGFCDIDDLPHSVTVKERIYSQWTARSELWPEQGVEKFGPEVRLWGRIPGSCPCPRKCPFLSRHNVASTRQFSS